MMDERLVSIVALLGWLILAIASLASFKLGWRKGFSMALVWAAIFTGVTIFIIAIRGH